MRNEQPSQRFLNFDGERETKRQERVERILGTVKQFETAGRYFTPEEYERATFLARGVDPEQNPRDSRLKT